MTPLSDQLTSMAERAKKAEDVVAAAQAKDRAALEAQRDQLQSSIDEGKAKAEASSAAAQQQVQSWWDETRSSVDNQFAALRAKRDEHRAERDLQRAERRADDAELDAADTVDFAMGVLVQAEYAVIDAVLARADADDLAQQQKQ
jgi:hypothetical protein